MTDSELTEVMDPILPAARYRFTFRAEKPLSRDVYLGSAWRGGVWARAAAVGVHCQGQRVLRVHAVPELRVSLCVRDPGG